MFRRGGGVWAVVIVTRTQVAIIGAGPAGLMLGHLLDLHGIDSVIVEKRSRTEVIERVRAGVLEQNTVDLMVQTGVGGRLEKESLRHEGVYIAFNGVRRAIDFLELTGRTITVYGQNKLVSDLIDARFRAGRAIHFGVTDVTFRGHLSDDPVVTFRLGGELQEVRCDFIAGCDGFNGVSRATAAPGEWTIYERVFPVAWLGIFAHAAPSSERLVYSLHERGFALFSMRSPELTRLYLECAPDDSIDQWPDDRIWAELRCRLTMNDGWKPNEGPAFQKAITPVRSCIVEPMQSGRLFLAGDAAHIVPPTGAKGLNLAAADVRVLAHALRKYYAAGDRSALDEYSSKCLRRVWSVQGFCYWMTSVLHRGSARDTFDYRRQIAALDYVTSSRAAMTCFAENYTGLPIGTPLPQVN